MTVLRVIREPSAAGATHGSLYVDDVWQCWTLEDPIREPIGGADDLRRIDRAAWVRTWKVQDDTAIPAGRYRLSMRHSPRFGRLLPALHQVPGYTDILIHGGNTAADTRGCLLVGQERAAGRVLSSQRALEALIARLATAGEPWYIAIENPRVMTHDEKE